MANQDRTVTCATLILFSTTLLTMVYLD